MKMVGMFLREEYQKYFLELSELAGRSKKDLVVHLKKLVDFSVSSTATGSTHTDILWQKHKT